MSKKTPIKPNKNQKHNKTQKTHWVGLFLKTQVFFNPDLMKTCD